MNPEEMQDPTIVEQDMPMEDGLSVDALTEDELAAAVGFTTTLSEGFMPQDAEGTEENMDAEGEDMGDEGEPEEEEEEPEPKEESNGGTDDAQDKEIEAIRAELEALKAEMENEPEGKDTESAKEA